METTQREFELDLPVGYADASGRVHRRAVIRKLRGHEEVLLYDPSLSPGRLVTELIRSCLVRLGELPEVDAELIARLYTADRNYLLLELRRITFGDRLPASYLCPRCGSEVAVVEDLGALEVRRLDDGETPANVELTLEDGYLDRQGELHRELTLSLPRGVDEEFVAPMVDKDPLKAQDALVLRCIRRFGTLNKAALEAYGVKILRDLTMGDRPRLHQALDGGGPGVSFERTVRCGGCGGSFQGVMDVTNFFVLG